MSLLSDRKVTNLCTAQTCLPGLRGNALEDAILDSLNQCTAHGQMVKPLTKITIQPGS